MSFDADMYTVTVRKENVDGDFCFVGRVAEFPNISSYEDTYEDARAMVVDSIKTLHTIAIEDGTTTFPEPIPSLDDEFSGRVTLRLPKSLHAKVSRQAVMEDVSVNQYLVTAIATYAGESDGLSTARDAIVNAVQSVTMKVLATTNQWITAATDQQFSLALLKGRMVTVEPSYSPASKRPQLKEMHG